MGKALIINGADFSNSAIVLEHRIVTALIGGGTGSGFVSPYKFGTTSKAEIEFELSSLSDTTSISVIGYRYGNARNYIAITLYNNGGTIRYWQGSNSPQSAGSSHQINKRYIFVLSRTECVVNGNHYSSTNPANPSLVDGVNFALIGNITSSESVTAFSSRMKVYKVKQWDNDGNLIIDALPCVKNDGTVCLYNKITDDYIYANNGENLSYED